MIKLIYIYIKMLAKSVLQQIFIVPVAAIYYKTRLRKKGVFNLIICDHIGDFIYTMGYAQDFCRQKHIKRLRVISSGRFKNLMCLYSLEECEFHTISSNWLHILCIANRYVSGQQLMGIWKGHCIVEPANGFLQGFDFAKQFPQLNLKDCICYGALNLKKNSQFDIPRRLNLNAEHTSSDLSSCISRKILLCPFAQAMHYDETEYLFDKLAVKFKEKNYKVYMNAARGQMMQIDAERVHYDLMELYERFEEYETVIGIRSGVLDLAVFSGCRVIALYPPANELTGFYDLRYINEHKKNLFQYQLTGDMEWDLYAIMQMNEEEKEDGSAIHYCTGGRKRKPHEKIDT